MCISASKILPLLCLAAALQPAAFIISPTLIGAPLCSQSTNDTNPHTELSCITLINFLSTLPVIDVFQPEESIVCETAVVQKCALSLNLLGR